MPQRYSYWLGCFMHYLRLPSGQTLCGSPEDNCWRNCPRDHFHLNVKTAPDMILGVSVSPDGCWDAWRQVVSLEITGEAS